MFKFVGRLLKRLTLSSPANFKVLFFPREHPMYVGRTEAKSVKKAKRIIEAYKKSIYVSVRPPEVWPNTLRGIRILEGMGADYLVYREGEFLPRHRY